MAAFVPQQLRVSDVFSAKTPEVFKQSHQEKTSTNLLAVSIMHLTIILQFAFFAAFHVVAAPAEPASQAYAVNGLLEKRANLAPVSCGRKI